MNYASLLNPKDIAEAEKFFVRTDVIKAQRIIEGANINISFQKGSTERYFIISGLIKDGNSAEARVTFKKSEDIPEGFITSNCNCLLWTKEKNCYHGAALFLKFYQNQSAKETLAENSTKSLQANVFINGGGVHVSDYGRIIPNANKLLGANANSTYSSLQYLLTNKSIAHFPIAEELKAVLKVNFVNASTLKEFEHIHNNQDLYFPLFSFEKDDKVFEKISLFEYLYLYNWDDGLAYTLPVQIKEFIKKILLEGSLQDINLFYKWVSNLEENPNIEFYLDDTPIKKMDYVEMNYRYSINQSTRKSYLNVDIEIFDKEEKLIQAPSFFNLMLNEGGLLSTFRTKNASFEFIENFVHSLDFDSNEYKKFIYSSSSKKKITNLIDYILNNETLVHVDPKRKCIFYTSREKFLLIYKSLYQCFGFNSSRHSFRDPNENKITFQIAKNQVLNNVASLYTFLKPINASIFYDKNEIKTWSSNIRFEREKSNLNWFDLSLIVTNNDYEVIKNAGQNEDYLLTSAGLVILENKEKELLKFMKKYTLHEKTGAESSGDNIKKFALNFKRARIFELFELKKHGITGALTQEEEKLCEDLQNLKEMPSYDLPQRYQDLARDYQVTGYQWLRFLFENKFGACLADDMGLGKTLQTIMFLQSIIDKVDRVLVICPVSILVNWQNEIKKFSDIEYQVYYGTERGKEINKKIILTSYGIMKKEAYSTFKDINFDVIIMDEVQHLKNIRSQGAVAARTLQGDFRICITGTPVENDLSEFYNIMDLSIPGIWGEMSFLKTTSTKKSRLLARTTVKPFILRRTKDEVLTELPEKNENIVYLDFNEKEREHYVSTLASIKKKMEEVQKGRKYSEILKSLLLLRQLCLWQNHQFMMSTKVDFLVENLEQLMEEGHKVLVFSQFTTYLDIIQNKVKERSWDYARIDGSQTLKKRASEVDRFQDGDAKIFLISLKAGGVGLNLTAASYIFLMDPWWNPAVENQAVDRAYRIGQKNNLTVYRPIIKNSVEEKVLVLQNTKRELFKDLMASDEDKFFDGKLKMDDFQSLLN